MTAHDHLAEGVRLHQLGKHAEAEKHYRLVLAREPEQPDALQLLGVLAHQSSQPAVAVDLIQRAIARRPADPQYHNNLGQALEAMSQLADAEAAYRRALALQPEFAVAHNNLGNILHRRRAIDEALAAYRRALQLQPDYAHAGYNLGNLLQEMGRDAEAIAWYQFALRHQPDLLAAANNLGNSLLNIGSIEEAAALFHQLVQAHPRHASAWSNLGNVLKQQGRLDEALAAFRRAIELEPGLVTAASNLVYTQHFHPGFDAKALAEEHRHWENQYARPLRPFIQPHANERSLARPLRIGYVSPDFREHPIGRFLFPLLAHHDKKKFKVIGYSQNRVADPMTQRLRPFTVGWRDIVGLADEQVDALIREDKIDILVDLTMHMSDNRLLVFARKPAPVQVTYLAYCSTTGLETIDYRLSDPYLDPVDGKQSIYSEKTIHLPETYWCYQPFNAPPDVAPMPAAPTGSVTFGSLNNFSKISEPGLRTWAAILRALPKSQLLIHAHEGSHRERVRTQMENEGVASPQLQFVGFTPTAQYFSQYNRIDIALDTFPYGGGTTSCDALWMGVPVVSLIGQTAVGRGGLSILSNLGLPELVANSEEEYVRIAIELAADLPRLGRLRSTLRQQMAASPLMDAPRFTRNVEAAYLMMWRNWCEGGIA